MGKVIAYSATGYRSCPKLGTGLAPMLARTLCLQMGAYEGKRQQITVTVKLSDFPDDLDGALAGKVARYEMAGYTFPCCIDGSPVAHVHMVEETEDATIELTARRERSILETAKEAAE